MPKVTRDQDSTTSPTLDIKPYSRASPPSTPKTPPNKRKAKTTPRNDGSGSGTGVTPAPSPSPSPSARKGAPWKAWELKAIFTVAITQGASTKTFEGVLPGRTGKACYDNWKASIVPYLNKCLDQRGK